MIEDNDTSTAGESEEEGSCCSNASCCPPQTPFTRSAPKVGRNDPCVCGSGVKFKKCCGKN